MTDKINVIEANHNHINDWLKLRWALWPQLKLEGHRLEIKDMLKSGSETAFLAFYKSKAVGLAECSIRKYAEGCLTNNVAYLEGWYVDKNYRRKGVGSILIKKFEVWAKDFNCTELASDCDLNNDISYKAHIKNGFLEVERAIHFMKKL